MMCFILYQGKKCSTVMLKKLTSYCSESSVLKAVAYQAVSQNI